MEGAASTETNSGLKGYALYFLAGFAFAAIFLVLMTRNSAPAHKAVVVEEGALFSAPKAPDAPAANKKDLAVTDPDPVPAGKPKEQTAGMKPPDAGTPAVAVAPTPNPTPVPAHPPAKAESSDDVYKHVSFNDLSGYFYEAPDPEAPAPKDPELVAKDQIPANIKGLNNKKVTIQGFMMPVKLDPVTKQLKSFLLVRNQTMCCFGKTPMLNEWIFVKMAEGKSTLVYMDQVVTVMGTLEVGENKDANGWVLSIYRMTGDNLEAAPSF